MLKSAIHHVIFILLATQAFASLKEEEKEAKNNRKQKFFSVFQIVTFPNGPCVGSATRNGTCFTAAECATKGGAANGVCANSYGVCCVFEIGCGQTSSQNCTYFTSTAANTGDCKIKICPSNSNICQLRLDFNTFSITGPSTDTRSVGRQINGNPVTGSAQMLAAPSGKSVSLATRCLVDSFQVTNPGGQGPPIICGLNTGQHMYVDASQECNALDFQIGSGSTGAAWSIKVTQYACDYDNLAPPGCNQYFFGNGGTGTVMTYNYQGGEQLANQNDAMCVRTERGFCRICWFAAISTDVQVSSSTPNKGYAAPNNCCRYGNSGGMTIGYDCVIILGAMTMANVPKRSRMCGNIGLVVMGGDKGSSTTATVCSCQRPFLVRFMSDAYEFTGPATASEAALKDKGVKLSYFEDTNCASAIAATGG